MAVLRDRVFYGLNYFHLLKHWAGGFKTHWRYGCLCVCVLCVSSGLESGWSPSKEPYVSRPACLGVKHPFGTRDQFFFLLEISFRQLRVYYFVAPSLTRGRVCNLLRIVSRDRKKGIETQQCALEPLIIIINEERMYFFFRRISIRLNRLVLILV
jgi:hypothetical protein